MSGLNCVYDWSRGWASSEVNMENKIDSVLQAAEICRGLISNRCQDNVIDIKPMNKKRHYLLTTFKGVRYQVLFKRAPFLSFGKIFGFKGCGDSVNSRYIAIAINNKIDGFLFVYQNGRVYYISPMEIFHYGQNFETIRTTKSDERTYSFPIKLLRQWC